jgi:hypothetical protein
MRFAVGGGGTSSQRFTRTQVETRHPVTEIPRASPCSITPFCAGPRHVVACFILECACARL